MENKIAHLGQDAVPPGQSVILVGCMNQKMIESVTASAKEQGVEVVMLSDKVVIDYLRVKGVEVPEVEAVTLEAFLADVNNRIVAEQQAIKLWAVMTESTEVEWAEEVEFNETQVVHRTTLSHKKAKELFNLLRAFGYLEWTDPKKRMFKLHFSASNIHNSIRKDILEMSKAINNDILRYKKSIEADSELSEQERNEKLIALQYDVLSSLSF